MGKKIQLGKAEIAEEVQKREKEATKGREIKRLMAVRMAMSGEFTLEQIGKAVGRARSRIAEWMKVVRESGLEAMLSKHQGRGKKPRMSAKAHKELRTGLRRGRWKTIKEARQWLEQRHRIKMGIGGVRYWVKKARAVLRVPRKTHALKNAAKVEEFQRTFARRLHELRIPKERPVRVWVSDEHRYGLIPTVRRSWGLRRVRTYARQRTRYQWSYTASALEVGGSNEAVVCIIPEVNTEWSLEFLKQIAEQDPESTHVMVWDGAGFHPKDGAPEVPANVRLIQLPAYSPELNPAEKVGACLRRALSNRLPKDLESLDQQAIEALRHLWQEPATVASLVGDGWLSLHVNVFSPLAQSRF